MPRREYRLAWRDPEAFLSIALQRHTLHEAGKRTAYVLIAARVATRREAQEFGADCAAAWASDDTVLIRHPSGYVFAVQK